MKNRTKAVIGGIEVYREGTRYTWDTVPTTWTWQSVGGGGQLRASNPRLVAADIGHWCESVNDAVYYTLGFSEGWQAAQLPPGQRLREPIQPKPVPPVPPVPEPAEPPLAEPIDARPPPPRKDGGR